MQTSKNYADVSHHNKLTRKPTYEGEEYVNVIRVFENHKNPFAVDRSIEEPLHNIFWGYIVPIVFKSSQTIGTWKRQRKSLYTEHTPEAF